MTLFTFSRASLVLALAAGPLAAQTGRPTSNRWHFRCGGKAAVGVTPIGPDMRYSAERGYGFRTPLVGATTTCSSDQPFLFDVALPEGNYDVTLVLGDSARDGETTVKAESRRLMLERVRTGSGKAVTRTFTVNVRTPAIAGGDSVRRKPREIGTATWDDRLTLEFNGAHPAVREISVVPAANPVTVFLAGNSTVVDQTTEPWAAWGQMIPRFFKPGRVVIANHAESGETLKAFIGERRLAKVLSTMKRGDYLFIEFAHNDQKPGSTYLEPFTTYKEYLQRYIDEARSRGATPVLVTSMHRRRFDSTGTIINTLGDYPAAVRQVAAEQHVALIDLNAMSKRFYEALGPERSTKAFVHYPANTYPGQTSALEDDTHFNNYGAYELARMVVEGLKKTSLPLARELLPDIPPYDPSHPDPLEQFALPASPFIAAAAAASGEYLFAYFKGNGEDGLHLAHSEDGFTWRALRHDSAFFTPTVGKEKLTRDPSIVRGPDGTYHMVWTAGWNEHGFGYAHSKDLITWEGETYVPAMAHEPTALNTWAPELLYDSPAGRFMIYWASTIPGRYPASDVGGGGGKYNHRLYFVTTTDFKTFTPTKLLYDHGFSVIDADIVRDGGRYVMFLKDETETPTAQKNIRLSFADHADGPWSAPTAPITGDYWAEGPTALRVGQRWIVYFDRYREHRYGALASADLKQWTDVSAKLALPDGIRHGTAFAAPAADVRRLVERFGP
ncbi:MAG: GDSL-type esterase/lipase family protein [bacterium]